MIQITKLSSKEVRAIVAKHYNVPIELVSLHVLTPRDDRVKYKKKVRVEVRVTKEE